VKALRLLFVFAASVPERVAATVLTTESAALPVVKSIGLLNEAAGAAGHGLKAGSEGGMGGGLEDQ
jgi:hypothetical protein